MNVTVSGAPRWLDAIVVTTWLMLRPLRPRRRVTEADLPPVQLMAVPALAGS